jgi:hypothetical protein
MFFVGVAFNVILTINYLFVMMSAELGILLLLSASLVLIL